MAETGRTTLVRILLVVAALVVAAVAVGGVWLATRGNDFLWSKVRSEDAVLLAGEEIPDEVSPEAWEEDLDHLAAALSRSFPRFGEAVERDRFEEEVEAVRGLLPELDRDETLFALMMVAAVLEAALGHEAEPVAGGPVAPEVAEALASGRWRFDPFRSLEVRRTGRGPRLEVAGVDRFIRSWLYPAEGPEEDRARLATDLRGVFLEVMAPAAERIEPASETAEPAAASLVLHWQGQRVELEPLEPGVRLPIELLREGRIEEGVAAYRELAAEGELPDSRTEFAVNRLGYELLEEERFEEAIQVFRLQTELFPTVANSWDSLGDAHRLAGEPERAAAAYREALERDPAFDHSRRMLEELGEAR